MPFRRSSFLHVSSCLDNINAAQSGVNCVAQEVQSVVMTDFVDFDLVCSVTGLIN